MRFFVPTANDPKQAEELYKQIREKVISAGVPIIDRRIYRLKYEHGAHAEIAVVGSDRHRFGIGPVVAIFAAADGTHYICTQHTVASDAQAHPLPREAVIEAEDFSALA